MSDPTALDRLQRRLFAGWEANLPGSGTEHIVVVLPSFGIGESLLSHYAARATALEHRYLVPLVMLGRLPDVHLLFLFSLRPEPAVVDHYLAMLPESVRATAMERVTILALDDPRPLSVATKLAGRPDVLDEVRRRCAGRPAMIEPWNVTAAEVAVAEAVDVPILGTLPELWPLGFKSSGRRLFAEAGVPVPIGVEDVHDLVEICAATSRIVATSPDAVGVVVKHDNSGAGDGNVVVRFEGGSDPVEQVRHVWTGLPAWYIDDLRDGGVVEELCEGPLHTSPSAQVDLHPDGDVTVRATHEQLVGGENGQVFLGCRLPASPVYAGRLGAYAAAVGEVLAARGCRGRVAVDFIATQGRGSGSKDGWDLRALEVNLRKGGTTHPYCVLRNLVPGWYDVEAGEWRTHADGSTRCYSATDNLVSPNWRDLPVADVLAATAAEGLHFDAARGTGVVLHMLSGLAVDGRCGLTAIGRTPAESDELLERTRAVLDAVAAGATSPQRVPMSTDGEPLATPRLRGAVS
jgi:hypothetical protein